MIVLFFGGNDAQAIQIDGVWHEFGSETWLSEYRTRVGDLMAELDEDGRDVYWMGMPIVRSDDFRQKVEVLNEIYRSEADRFEGVTFVDSWSVFTGPDGAFSEYLTDANGDLVDMRLNDGIHLTTAGGIRLAEVTFGVIAEQLGDRLMPESSAASRPDPATHCEHPHDRPVPRHCRRGLDGWRRSAFSPLRSWAATAWRVSRPPSAPSAPP